MSIYLIDSRIAFYCTNFDNFDRGGGWLGFGLRGFTVAGIANAVGKAKARRRFAGKVMVSHIRYEWLNSVGFNHKNFSTCAVENAK
jgi:hypothetical protein